MNLDTTVTVLLHVMPKQSHESIKTKSFIYVQKKSDSLCEITELQLSFFSSRGRYYTTFPAHVAHVKLDSQCIFRLYLSCFSGSLRIFFVPSSITWWQYKRCVLGEAQ